MWIIQWASVVTGYWLLCRWNTTNHQLSSSPPDGATSTILNTVNRTANSYYIAGLHKLKAQQGCDLQYSSLLDSLCVKISQINIKIFCRQMRLWTEKCVKMFFRQVLRHRASLCGPMLIFVRDGGLMVSVAARGPRSREFDAARFSSCPVRRDGVSS